MWADYLWQRDASLIDSGPNLSGAKTLSDAFRLARSLKCRITRQASSATHTHPHALNKLMTINVKLSSRVAIDQSQTAACDRSSTPSLGAAVKHLS